MSAPEAVVFIVDDDDAVRRAVARLLRSADLTAVPCDSAEAFLAHAPYAGPACLVLDVRLPGLSGPKLQEMLRTARRRTPVIFLSAHGSIPMTVRTMRAGAVDFLTKPVEDETLLAAVRGALEAAEREWWQQADLREIRRRLASLTAREREVMALVVTGRRNKVIAAELGIAEKTVKVHRGRVMHKMSAESLAHLVRLTERVGNRRRTD